MPKYLWQDQKAIWTSPFHTSKKDVKYWAIFGAATVAFVATDKLTVKALPNSSSQVSVSTWGSRFGSAYALIPITAGFYFIGSGTHEQRLRETGLLGFETLIDSTLVVEALKLVSDRARPTESDGKGHFWDSPNGRWNSSFPSGHAINVWAVASVVAHQYPHPRIVPILAYGLASTVCFARVGARQHFPGDVVAGSAMGWFIGDYVYGHLPPRHNRDLDQKRSASQKAARLRPLRPVGRASSGTRSLTVAALMELRPVVVAHALSSRFSLRAGLTGARAILFRCRPSSPVPPSARHPCRHRLPHQRLRRHRKSAHVPEFAEIRIGDTVFMVVNGDPRPMAFHLSVPDVEAAYQRALDHGATSLQGRANVTDPFGNHWYLATEGAPTIQPFLHHSPDRLSHARIRRRRTRHPHAENRHLHNQTQRRCPAHAGRLLPLHGGCRRRIRPRAPARRGIHRAAGRSTPRRPQWESQRPIAGNEWYIATRL